MRQKIQSAGEFSSQAGRERKIRQVDCKNKTKKKKKKEKKNSRRIGSVSPVRTVYKEAITIDCSEWIN